jgi:hypothetical protein
MNTQVYLQEKRGASQGCRLSVPGAGKRAEGEASGVRLQLEWRQKGGVTFLRARVESVREAELFVGLEMRGEGEVWTFEGPAEREEIYRQSPHDPDAWIVKGIARQPVPVAAFRSEGRFSGWLHGSPALFANGCSQHVMPAEGRVVLRTGDDAATPGLAPSAEDLADLAAHVSSSQILTPGRVIEVYQPVGPGEPLEVDFVPFETRGGAEEDLRAGVYDRVTRVFGPPEIRGRFGSMAFATAWMNLRVNDTGRSRYWVVPAADYSNTQYNRDAFWIASMLEPEMDRECLLHELAAVDGQAEYPLFAVIWAHRVAQRGVPVDSARVQDALDVVLSKTHDGWYRAYLESDGRHDFQYWGDVVAFEAEDSIAYNQGLLALALRLADEMGLNLKGESAFRASENYRSMFSEDRKHMMQSRKKPHLFSPDALLPDALSQIMTGKALLTRDIAADHLDTLNRHALTDFGYKVLCRADREFPADEDFNIPGYVAQANQGDFGDGGYHRGGSWLLYDAMCLLDGVLHGVPCAAQLLVWRLRLELDRFGTTYEYLNTLTGEPHKSNMGWNVAVYAFLRQLTDEGRVSPELLNQIEAGR